MSNFLELEASLARTTCPVNEIKLVRPKQLGVNPRSHFVVAQAWRLAVGSWQQICKLLSTAFHLPPGTFEWSHNLAVLPSLQCAFENYDLWRLWPSKLPTATTNWAVDDRRSQIQKNRIICLLLWQQSIKKKNIGMNAQNMKNWVADDLHIYVCLYGGKSLVKPKPETFWDRVKMRWQLWIRGTHAGPTWASD